jgi:hypothetical protein
MCSYGCGDTNGIQFIVVTVFLGFGYHSIGVLFHRLFRWTNYLTRKAGISPRSIL